ncbi:MAG TPA: hypothetical protein PLH48_15465 [Acinetobacter johnsonii]|jgi:hypothetical protein|nr:hypothetical protein [Acinetobacter johnsonii]
MKLTSIFLCCFGLCISSFTNAKKPIPMSDSLYNGKYFLLSNTKNNNINTVVYQANFKTETVFSKMEINCSTRKYRKIGEGINSVNTIDLYEDKGKWTSPFPQASHDDVVKFICKK